jgi:CBS domain-containing protein
MESRTEVSSLKAGGVIRTPVLAWGPRRDTLRVGEIMSQEVVTATPEDTIFSVAQKMADQNVTCVVVTNKGRVVGILTEKDMLSTMAGQRTVSCGLCVSGQMTSPVDTVTPETSLLEADRIMETHCIRRLPVVEDGQLVGIVTQTDITRVFISLSSLGCVSEIMTQPVTTVSVDAMALEAARLISCSNLSCLLVMHDQTAAGVLTERDLLKRVIAPQKDLTQTRVADVMSLPVVTIPATCSILDASNKMETRHFHRLFVTDGQKICGIVTQTDIMGAVRRSTEALESQQRTVQEELTVLVQRAIRDLQRVRDFLDDIPHPPNPAGEPASDALPTPQGTVFFTPALAEKS